jgi:hypothetical protein
LEECPLLVSVRLISCFSSFDLIKLLSAAAPLDETKQSHIALSLVRCPPPSQIFQDRKDILTKMDEYFSKDIRRRHV